MIFRNIVRCVITLAFVIALNACSSMGGAKSLFTQLGGMDQVTKLASGFMSNMATNPKLSGLLGSVNTTAAADKLSNQLCSSLGGGCKAPFSSDQVANAASKLSTDQRSAVADSFKSALNTVSTNPALKEAITQALGSKVGGIVGSLL